MNTLIKLAAVLAAVVILAVPAHATQNVVYAFGRQDITVPVSQSINISVAGGSAKISKQVGGPASGTVPRFTPETTVAGGILSNQEVTFGPYTVATVVRIEANADPVFYAVGKLAAVLPVLLNRPRIAYTQLAPIAYTTTQLLLASDLMNGLITATHAAGATQAYTLPTGTLMDAASGLGTNMGFEWTLINLSGTPATNTITLTAGSGHTIVGEAIVGTATIGTNSARWFTRKTAANTFITYRLH